uniref:UDP-glucose 4-epimerase n=1 Tax=Schmidtea mediterranea TaxID=79327 RepID=I1ZIA2_SCHMD|nr:UDP galactose 4 epimerase [Schmidtea mediterranea]
MSKSKQIVLVTGGVGYIGSHTVIELFTAGYEVVIIDNLCNANKECLNRIEKITKNKFAFHEVDMLNKKDLSDLFNKYKFHHVIHFAALKAVGESVALPLKYYKNNIIAALNLIEVMADHGVKSLVFSSSATVYGTPKKLPITELDSIGGCTNPYGKTKWFIEEMLFDICKVDTTWSVVILRYFNPVGSHKSGMIGEDPLGPPANLMPFVAQVAVGKRPHVNVFGNDYPTNDGTGVRDYIHVVDLAQGHIKALEKLNGKCGLKIYNLGTGRGYSVLEMITAFEQACGHKIPYEIAPRRPGDLPEVYADTKLAEKELNWKSIYGLKEMCEDLWNWQQKNPEGYSGVSK